VIFKDRKEAGEKLAKVLLKKKLKSSVVISLLRGGIIVGQEVSKKLKIPHLPLAVAKIPAPSQSELAIGALCFDFTYLDPKLINSLNIDRETSKKQILIAKEKFRSYLKRFGLKKSNYRLKNKVVILVDDGVATGSTVKAALLFVKSLKPHKIILATPIAPDDFENPGFDEVVIIHRDPSFSSVSQFYKEFPQIKDDEVGKIFSLK